MEFLKFLTYLSDEVHWTDLMSVTQHTAIRDIKQELFQNVMKVEF